MKNTFLLLFTLLLFNCNNKNLETEIKKLKEINKNLLDSIGKLNYKKLTSAEMILISSNNGRGAKFDGMIYNQLKGFNYDLYQIDTLHYTKNVTKKLILKNCSSPQFNIEADKDLIKNKTLYLLAEYNLDSLKLQIPGILYLNGNDTGR